MPSQPCLGCGFSLDSNGDLQINGVTRKNWPYVAPNHIAPTGWYCDTGPDGIERLWVQPWNLPWGKVAAEKGNVVGTYKNGLGSSEVCDVAVTFEVNRCYRITGSMEFQADQASVAPTTPSGSYSGWAGGVLYSDPAYGGTGILSKITMVVPQDGWANDIVFTHYLENDTGVNLTRHIHMRSYSYGYINARAGASNTSNLVIEDIGPRL